MLTLPPLSLYVHLPWCARKCPYCDFNSHAAGADLPEDAYVERLLLDLEQDLPLAQGRSLCSVFIGGGTPSLFSVNSIRRLIIGIGGRLPLDAGAEITMEANPGSAERDKFQALREAGINRLSIGVQSFDDRFLQELGRVHDARQAHAALEAASRAGFASFNVDLMHGLPGQRSDGACADLEAALSHSPRHLSWYQLTIEPNTVFHRRPPVLPDEDLLGEIQEAGLALLRSRGLKRYEVSAFAGARAQSRHNLNYWLFGDYLGIGAGAHGKISFPAQDCILRTYKTRSPRDYLGVSIDTLRGDSAVPREQRALEYMMNALRLVDGVPAHNFAMRTGLPENDIGEILAGLRRDGLLLESPDRHATSETGLRFLNDVVCRFI